MLSFTPSAEVVDKNKNAHINFFKDLIAKCQETIRNIQTRTPQQQSPSLTQAGTRDILTALKPNRLTEQDHQQCKIIIESLIRGINKDITYLQSPAKKPADFKVSGQSVSSPSSSSASFAAAGSRPAKLKTLGDDFPDFSDLPPSNAS